MLARPWTRSCAIADATGTRLSPRQGLTYYAPPLAEAGDWHAGLVCQLPEKPPHYTQIVAVASTAPVTLDVLSNRVIPGWTGVPTQQEQHLACGYLCTAVPTPADHPK